MIEETEILENEDTHDIYAWTPVWNGTELWPVHNCSKDFTGRAEGAPFEPMLGGPVDPIDLTKEMNQDIIYFFGKKTDG